MGKSRLALACGRRALTSFRDGVFLVGLDGKARSVAAVAEAIGDAVGLKSDSGLRQRLPAELGERQSLLILDNYESVACPEVAAFLGELLAAAPEVSLLVTGRELVNLANVERQIDLDSGMEAKEARDLFIVRARLKKGADWEPRPDQAGELRRIIASTEQSPLAIEFAAAWVNRKSLRQIADDLERRGGAKPPPNFVDPGSHHASLWQCQDWSFGLLNAAAQEGFVKLGIFPDSFTLDAGARICAIRDIPGLVYQLQDSALVRRHGDGDPARYRMHRFTQEYAYEKLEGDEVSFQAIRRRFVEFFAAGAAERCGRVDHGGATPGEIVATLEWTEAEWRNVCAAVEWATADRGWDAVGRLSSLLLYFAQRRGHLQASEQLFERLLDLVRSAPAAADAAGEGTLLNALGVICQFRRNLQRAVDYFLAALRVRTGTDRAKTLNSLGTVYQACQRWAEAKTSHEESLEICLAQGDRHEEAKTLNNLGLVYECLGDTRRAVELLERSLELWRRELVDPGGEADALNGLGEIYQRREDWPRGRRCFEARLRRLEEIGDRVGQARTLNSLGYIARREGRWPEAEEKFRLAVAICVVVEDSVEEGEAHRNLGELFEAQGRLAEAVEPFERSRRLRQGLDRARVSSSLGWVYERLGRRQEAEECYRSALEICREVGDRGEEETSRRNLERVRGGGP